MKITNVIQSRKEFDELLKGLNEAKSKEYVAVNAESNPVAKAMRSASSAQLAYILQQYRFFPKEIISLFEAAKAKALEAGWEKVAQELQRIIDEELGSVSNGIAHYAILVRGLKQGLGVAVNKTKPSTASSKFISSLKYILSKEVSYTFGAAYALEATAAAETEIFARVANLLFEGAMPQDLKYYFDMHISEWEPGHEEGLRTTAAKCLDVLNFTEFEAGFRAVMEAMDAWWNGLNEEALSLRAIQSATTNQRQIA